MWLKARGMHLRYLIFISWEISPFRYLIHKYLCKRLKSYGSYPNKRATRARREILLSARGTLLCEANGRIHRATWGECGQGMTPLTKSWRAYSTGSSHRINFIGGSLVTLPPIQLVHRFLR